MPSANQAHAQDDAVRADVAARYCRVRAASEALCRPLEIEDYGLQTMPDVSPAKWHIAHTSWFFETFLLLPFAGAYRVHDPAFDHLFNSYYLTHGQPFLRPQRGVLSRPTVAEVYDYRQVVDDAMITLIGAADGAEWTRIEPLIQLGLNHEQQHQELLLTDLKHAFFANPLRPAYRQDLPVPPVRAPVPGGWQAWDGGLHEIGAAGPDFAYDNERPRHRCWLEDFALAEHPVSNAEYLAFIEDGGYREPQWWLSEGWATVQSQAWEAPLYWERRDGAWWQFTLAGMRPLDLAAPVTHVSFYEADAFAAWAGRRLPLETEWERVAVSTARGTDANLRDTGWLQPVAGPAGQGMRQLFGDVWEWTASAYTAYPGFQTAEGPVGEYNGKFMSGQMVLRGGSCVTPADHIRASYRNFFYPHDRWQFSGIRLAEDR
ncbi:MAG: ergothioneine biosynthesis protein EgtB [Chromatiaceae bacterium]|nr:ergothioneine biosynthesis protein EgtB [Gammaproteobacteria bacterium]MCP5303937.1 ergothioneine biosynthesis protein EgtB [Chromatiaceae bacterium]MCP5313664.1 ergothioneine biosynthesis protein EgtB [Chromatiaceae bacterium]